MNHTTVLCPGILNLILFINYISKDEKTLVHDMLELMLFLTKKLPKTKNNIALVKCLCCVKKTYVKRRKDYLDAKQNHKYCHNREFR